MPLRCPRAAVPPGPTGRPARRRNGTRRREPLSMMGWLAGLFVASLGSLSEVCSAGRQAGKQTARLDLGSSVMIQNALRTGLDMESALGFLLPRAWPVERQAPRSRHVLYVTSVAYRHSCGLARPGPTWRAQVGRRPGQTAAYRIALPTPSTMSN